MVAFSYNSKTGDHSASSRTGSHQHAHSGSHQHAHSGSAKQGSNDLIRFSVAMPEDLLVDFDQLVARRGLAKNRSEVIRDLVREALVESRSSVPGTLVMGTLTIVYDHHSNDLQEKLHRIQHDYFDNIVSTMHVHVDSDICLEVIVLRGETVLVHTIADLIAGTKGVQNGSLVLSGIDSR